MGSKSIAAVTFSSSSSFSGEKSFPPGFRFHPTDEELLLYYLKRKICRRSLKLDIIGEIDVCKWEPEELPGQAKWRTGDRHWFFFCHRDRKYPNGGKLSRGTMRGYWKVTGKDRIVKHNSRSVGIKKTLVYYKGRAPSGQRTDWVMHEYTMDEEELKRCKNVQEHYALCKIFKKSGPGPKNGEQYGAPFVEEEWTEDYDCLNIEELLVKNTDTLVKPMVEPVVPPLAQSNLVNNEEQIQSLPLVVQPGSHVAKEPSQITSVEPLVMNEGFLEMDDLLGPQPIFQNSELPFNDLQFAGVDEFCAFDFYNDSTEFHAMTSFKSQQIQPPYYMNNLDFGSEAINTGFQMGYDQNQATNATISTPSGLNEKPGKPDSGWNQNQKSGEDDGSDSWFSSALWAFVESIPTSPASALECSALGHQAFDQMPGISDSNGNFEGTYVTRRVKRSLRSRGIVYFSVLGVLFAILCVFVGTSIELLGRWIFV